jgi:hypothetical protein
VAPDTAPIRRDLPFLRRRVKPGRSSQIAVDASYAPAAPPARAVAPASLTLSRPSTTPRSAQASAPDAPLTSSPESVVRRNARRAIEPFPAPVVAGVRELGEVLPMLRLNARQSAVGSLIVTGAAAVVWESDELVTGVGLADGTIDGTPVMTSGNRPLVGFDGGEAVVTLRSLHRLRRVLFIGEGDRSLGVRLFDGSRVTVATGNSERVFALSLLRIGISGVGALLELRAEPIRPDALAALPEVQREFGFVLTAQVPGRAPRRR